MKTRKDKSWGKDPRDFEHRCKFKDQIAHIGAGTADGTGEEVLVKMQSGKTAAYRLFAEHFYIFSKTGQMNWRYLFVEYR